MSPIYCCTSFFFFFYKVITVSVFNEISGMEGDRIKEKWNGTDFAKTC